MAKKTGIVLIAAGVLTLVAAILFFFAVGGPAVPVLTICSILLNSVGITLVRGKY